MNWPRILSNMRRLEEECKAKVLNARRKKFQKLFDQFTLNVKAEVLLREIACLNIDMSLEICDEKRFENRKMKKEYLIAFIWLRETDDLQSGDVQMPSYNRGSYSDIERGKTGPFLFQEAYKLRGKTPCQKQPTLTLQDEVSPLTSSPPVFIRVGNRLQVEDRWTVSKTFIDTAFRSISNLQHYSDDERERWMEDYYFKQLEDDSLRKSLAVRCSTHLRSNFERVDHPVWKWLFSNLGPGSAILKLTFIVKNNETILKSGVDDTLFSPSFVSNHDMFNDTNEEHHGSYLAKDRERGTVIRSGSASVGCKQRVQVGHPKGAKQTAMKDQENHFYSLYPARSSEHVIEEMREGWFEDIEFFPGIIFSDVKKEAVQALFVWNEHIVAFLNGRLGDRDLKDKKHRMVCYFFETILEFCIAPRDNVSKSLGFETFILKINSGADEEWLEHEQYESVVDLLEDDGDVVMVD